MQEGHPGDQPQIKPEEIDGTESTTEATQDFGDASTEIASPDETEEANPAELATEQTEAATESFESESAWPNAEPEYSIDNGGEPDELSSPAVTNNDAQLREGEEGRVDNSKAWDMAHASHGDRAAAAEYRKEEKARRRALDMITESNKLASEAEPSGWGLRAHQARRYHRRQVDSLRAEGAKLAGNMPLDDEFHPPDRMARWRDELAEAREEWAGILHDKPVSQAFIDAHSGVEFTPESLAHFEFEIRRDTEKADKYVEEFDDEKGFKTVVTAEESAEFADMLTLADQDSRDEYTRLSSQLDDTVEAINALRRKIYEANKIQPLRNRIALMQALVDDVRSGRASEG